MTIDNDLVIATLGNGLMYRYKATNTYVVHKVRDVPGIVAKVSLCGGFLSRWHVKPIPNALIQKCRRCFND